jgi:hypothetical protein
LGSTLASGVQARWHPVSKHAGIRCPSTLASGVQARWHPVSKRVASKLNPHLSQFSKEINFICFKYKSIFFYKIQMQYNVDYVCTYIDPKIVESDNLTSNEHDYIVQILYQSDILSIFNVDSPDEIDEQMHQLYINLHHCCPFLMQRVEKIAVKHLFVEQADLGFVLAYSADYLHEMHTCVCEFLKEGNISDASLLQFDNKIDGIYTE